MDPIMLAMAIATITDRLVRKYCPPGEDLEEYRAKVQAEADNEEDWLETILKKTPV